MDFAGLDGRICFRTVKLRFIRQVQLGTKTIECCANGLPRCLQPLLRDDDGLLETWIVLCVSSTDEKGRKLAGTDAALSGRALVVAKVNFTFTRDEAEAEQLDCGMRDGTTALPVSPEELQSLLDANPSSKDKKYKKFISLDTQRMTVFEDPGVPVPATALSQRLGAAWRYKEDKLLEWLEDALGGPRGLP